MQNRSDPQFTGKREKNQEWFGAGMDYTGVQQSGIFIRKNKQKNRYYDAERFIGRG